MRRDRYSPVDIFDLAPALSTPVAPVLTTRDHLLEDDTLFPVLKADLAQRYPRTWTDGRPSTPVEVIMRLLVIRHLSGWSYAQTAPGVADSLLLRQFCRVYLRPIPDATTLIAGPTPSSPRLCPACSMLSSR